MNIPVSDLRKGNLIQTEYGILPVHAISFNDIQVKAKDGRILWAKQFKGIDILNFTMPDSNIEQIRKLYNEMFKSIHTPAYSLNFVHELQNWYYWNSGKKELEIII